MESKLDNLELKTCQMTEQKESERLDDCIQDMQNFINRTFAIGSHTPKTQELIRKQFQLIINKALDN
jgi:hypothetical protein